MTQPPSAARIDDVLRFHRSYTWRIGALGERCAGRPFSATQARVLFELAHRGCATAAALGADLGLDAGYLDRILRDFESHGLVQARPSPADARQTLLGLTEAGKAASDELDARARRELGAVLGALPPHDLDRLAAAMREIERTLRAPAAPPAPFRLRPPRAGDLGWIVHRHGALYAEEYGWDRRFEGLVAHVVADFVARFDAQRDCAWIAERDDRPVGSALVVQESAEVARLRLLLVEPAARGLGIGRQLVQECLRFARGAGYRKVTLWTNDVLHAARRIYEQAGFQLTKAEPHYLFGEGLVGQTWERTL